MLIAIDLAWQQGVCIISPCSTDKAVIQQQSELSPHCRCLPTLHPRRPEVDEEEAARDVARAMSTVRPLLRQYEQRYEELGGRLSRAQAGAASATREARERCEGQLQTFERLGETCTKLARDFAGA